MLEIQFNKLLEYIQPISLSFYVDEYSSKQHSLDNYTLSSGDYKIDLHGHCLYADKLVSYNFHYTLWDADNQEITLEPDQYKKLKISLINNIIIDGR